MAEDPEALTKAHRVSEYQYGAMKYVYTPLSKVFTAILIRTPVTPNQVTIFWGLLMIVSSIAMATGDLVWGTLGGIGWVVAYTLDFCDGDIARQKDLRSKRGIFQDLVNHRATYPLLMFCAGYGAYHTGITEIFGITIEPSWYLILGFLAGLGMIMIMDLGDIYNKSFPEGAVNSDKGSATIEGARFNDKPHIRLILNFNPLLFTNMMLLIPVFAVLDLMEIFVIFYGVMYPLAAFGRYVILYRRVPGVQKSS